MEYNDERLLSPKEYEQLAKAYSVDLKKRDFAFVRLDKIDNTPLLKEIFDIMNLITSSLLALGNFLGTGVLYNLNERQIQNLELLFGVEHDPFPCRVGRDKTKCFLNYLSLESNLLQKLKKLAEGCSYSRQVEEILLQRLEYLEKLFEIKNFISSSPR